ncbi:MAG: hypothetical protein GY896_18385 [Gammaproteobacteria bacterium]|nr:hypothetical protein [Gammaproteobacteria bacterium]
MKRIIPLMTHPVLRPHAEIGRTPLNVNEYYTSQINELSEVESDGLSRLLHHHTQLPDFQVCHSWQANDIAFRDKRCTRHYASTDHAVAHRVTNRETLFANKPFFNKSTD